MRAIIILFCLTASVLSLKLFLVGGAAGQFSSQVFTALGNVIPSRPAQPNKCDQNWDTTKCPRIAVATSAAGSQADGNDSYTNDTESMSYKTLFLKYGLAPKHLTLHRDNFKIHSDISTPQGKANADIVRQADIVFFNGGDQLRHLRSWLKDDGTPSSLLQVVKDRLLRDDLVCSGSSAGSMIWANQTFGQGNAFGILYFKNSVGLAPKKISDGQVDGTGLSDTRNGTKSLQYYYNGGRAPAFGILNFTVDTHFNARGRLGRLAPVLVDLRQKFGIGLDQNTSLYYNNGLGTVYGWNGVTFCDIQHALVYPLAYFTINNVTTHYLTHGDQFDFKTRTVISNKSAINSPAYPGPTDSSDILSPYEATMLQTRVVDQKSLYNLGRSKKPTDFPARTTPTFELKFYRGQQSKGYYSDKKYTTANVLVDFSFGTNIEQYLNHPIFPARTHRTLNI